MTYSFEAYTSSGIPLFQAGRGVLTYIGTITTTTNRLRTITQLFSMRETIGTKSFRVRKAPQDGEVVTVLRKVQPWGSKGSGTYTVTSNSTSTSLTVTVVSAGHESRITVDLYLPADYLPLTIPSGAGSYGLSIHNSAGAKTFDSRVLEGRPQLRYKRRGSVTLTTDKWVNVTTLATNERIGISNPVFTTWTFSFVGHPRDSSYAHFFTEFRFSGNTLQCKSGCYRGYYPTGSADKTVRNLTLNYTVYYV